MESKTKLATIAVAYGLCVATCYLWTYWGAFGINVFEYASVSDVATRAILPVAAALLPLAFGSSMAELSPLRRMFPPGGGRNTRAGVFLNRHVRLVYALSIIAGVAIILMLTSPWRWLIAMLFFWPVMMVLVPHPLMVDIIPDERFRHWLISVGIFAIFIAAGRGALNADRIIRGDSERVVDESTVGVPLKATLAHPVEYIGYVGGMYFLYETQTRSVVILKQTDHDPIVLKPRIVSEEKTSH
ncbi:hypothetical protein [Burkholderia seminalis]|uniref:hypothetical protein n=1 Tax=Burkholderia seminalis TaxID=488731 RepID=UPI0019076FCD|nr:hypothetical protein [Burkholderia seminalis]MBJ9968141.1 hypothetical protein [Burkholderia seminalis]